MEFENLFHLAKLIFRNVNHDYGLQLCEDLDVTS